MKVPCNKIKAVFLPSQVCLVFCSYCRPNCCWFRPVTMLSFTFTYMRLESQKKWRYLSPLTPHHPDLWPKSRLPLGHSPTPSGILTVLALHLWLPSLDDSICKTCTLSTLQLFAQPAASSRYTCLARVISTTQWHILLWSFSLSVEKNKQMNSNTNPFHHSDLFSWTNINPWSKLCNMLWYYGPL